MKQFLGMVIFGVIVLFVLKLCFWSFAFIIKL